MVLSKLIFLKVVFEKKIQIITYDKYFSFKFYPIRWYNKQNILYFEEIK